MSRTAGAEDVFALCYNKILNISEFAAALADVLFAHILSGEIFFGINAVLDAPKKDENIIDDKTEFFRRVCVTSFCIHLVFRY